eukprot:TRINITY_DN14077_c0_g1_i1.p1 TRINITY_DN14077_c0_g1~~TRINITY_DN14077_c0_g1_i1.p1  ORF type:complete len:103 (-),score=3.09 TRINITY_DN14077_c0_g1_i1:19-327(-)
MPKGNRLSVAFQGLVRTHSLMAISCFAACNLSSTHASLSSVGESPILKRVSQVHHHHLSVWESPILKRVSQVVCHASLSSARITLKCLKCLGRQRRAHLKLM